MKINCLINYKFLETKLHNIHALGGPGGTTKLLFAHIMENKDELLKGISTIATPLLIGSSQGVITVFIFYRPFIELEILPS